MRPASAPKRSASIGTLLALGRAATSTSTTAENGSSGTPAAMARRPAPSTTRGCRTSLQATIPSKPRAARGAGCVIWLRASMQPSANSATGDAAAASISTADISGLGNSSPVADDSVPSAIAHGSGLVSMPRSARATAARASLLPAPACPSCDNPMHSEVVSTMSSARATMAGAAAACPSSATSSGTPMKPLFGKAATSAPNEASAQPIARRRATSTVSATTTSALPR